MARRVIELMDDMHLSSQSTFLDYYYAMQANNISQASSILANNPTIKNQIMIADNINILLNETYRRELQPKVDIDYFLAGLQAVFEKMILYTQVRGEWSKDIQYNVHNFVYYNGKGYYAYTNSEPPIGTLPTDTKYWLEYDVRGAKGYGGINLNLKFAWDSTQNYKKGDVVIFKNKMWWAIADNINYEPNLNHYPWSLIMLPDKANKTPIQKEEPTSGYNIGDFWFKITQGEDVIQTAWKTKTPEPAPRFASASFMIGNNIYVVGGQNRAIIPTNTNEAYDVITNTWSTKANYPVLADGVFGFEVNGIGYCAGGLNANLQPMVNAYSYNPNTNTWAKVTDLPEPLASVNSTTSYGEYGYCIGGITATGKTADSVYRFTPATLTWDMITNMPLPRYSPAVESLDGKIYAIGGSDSLGNIYGDVQIYDIATNTWSTGKNMLNPRGFSGSFKHENDIYVVGGLDEIQYATNLNEIYNTKTNTWKNDIPMTYIRASLCGEANNSKGYAIGGIDIARADINGYVEEYSFVQSESSFEMLINTTLGSKTVSIPMTQDGNYNYWIDWGDEFSSTQITTYDDTNATHTYASDGEYTIRLTGTLDRLLFTGDIAKDLKEVTKSTLTYSSIESMFKDCINLTSVPSDIFSKSSNIESAISVFEGCTKLQTIPIGLFDNNSKIISFVNTFKNTGLISIPLGLFNANQKVTDFSSTFSGTHIASIPEGLFDNNSNVLKFNETFGACEKLVNIPNNLFVNCPTVVTYAYCFRDCSALTNIPMNIFGEALISTTNMEGIFSNCTGITTIPQGLFQHGTSVTSYKSAFNGTNTTTISDNAFNGVNASTDNIFDISKIVSVGKNSLKGLNIPAGFFQNNTVLKTVGENALSESYIEDMNNIFNGCTALTDLGNWDLTNISTASGDCFKGCSNLTNLSGFKDVETLTKPTIKNDFLLADCSKLTHESLMNVVDSLVVQTPTTIKTLYLSSTSLALLTDVEKLVIINKYWNLDGYTPNVTEQVAKDLVLELEGHPGLTSTIVESTSLYYYVSLENTSTSTNVGTYAVDKTTGYVYEENSLPQYEYYILTNNNSGEEKSYWVAKGTDNDIEGNVLRNKLSELNNAGNLVSIQIGAENSGALNTGIEGDINLNELCKNFTHLNSFTLQDTNATPISTAGMFDNCQTLVNVNFGDLNVSKISNMSSMFRNCKSMTNSNYSFISSWSNSACTTMEQMFLGNTKLTTMLNIKMPNVKNVSYMYSSTGLTSITGNLLGQKIDNAKGLFADCTLLIGLPSDYRTIFGSNNALVNVSYLFKGCTKLAVKLDNDPLSYNQDGTITVDETKRNNQILRNCPNITNASHIFENCTGVTDLPVFVFWYNPKLIDVSYAFSGCSSMAFQAPETGAETALLHNNIALTNISYLFQGCTNIVSFLSIPGYWGYGAYDTLTKLTNVAGLFKNSGADSMLFDIGLPKNSPDIIDISEFYSECKSISNIPFGTEVATNMPKLQNCSKLCYNCININQYGEQSGAKEYGNNVIYPIAQLSTLTSYADAFTNCSKLTDYANLPMGWRNGSTSTQTPNNIAIALAKTAFGTNADNFSWTVSSTSGNEYTVQCKATGSTTLTATYVVNIQTGKVIEQ